ncbi:DUF2244 domain-containing protein [Alkalilacustris brevis]|uniref:DUF2244 domain-containing protein n=1 Tax=Alkalilacustris brevis TaxID=2026338 RepID=UPI000E0D8337|nr:DUF2244 domain-containing protein [Alkalilacustris brevis]
MPYEWVKGNAKAPALSGAFYNGGRTPPAAVLHLWPHRSLPARGFVLFIALTCGLVAVPLLAVLGTPVLWGLLPFVVLVIGGVWYAIQRNYRDGQVLEELSLWSDHLRLQRHGPRGQRREWEANPYWTRLHLHEKDGPVENYLTIEGAGREVELGAFLSPKERRELFEALRGIMGGRAG